ncbi:MAG: VanZ family protein [Gemmatimonadetes bacterium]|nr:VanZ family protein [Gemmatimonadota bacterium]MCA9761840.1 VanZ family protein [Gemmatimonadota bacterium]MCB9504727.1 VanZ family protein [Gemmatimonadales bacterium]
MSDTRWRVAAAGWVALVLALTLWPNPGAAQAIAETPWWCIVCGAHGGADVFQNLLLLLPLGFCLGRGGWPRGRSLLVVFLLPIGIEALQGLAIPGRDAALGDVLANAVGGVLGLAIGARLRHRPIATARLAPAAVGLFALQLAGSSWLLEPELAGPRPWVEHPIPRDPGRPIYAGAVARAAPPRADQVSWTVTWAPADEPAMTPIARLEDAKGSVLTALDRRGDHLGIEVRIRAAALRLRNPAWLVPVPPARPGDTLTVSLRREAGRIHLGVRTAQDSTARSVAVGSQHGWALINPFSPSQRSDASWARWTVAWLLGWGMLLGWAAAGTGRPLLWGVGAVGLLLLGTAMSHTLASPAEVGSLLLGWLLAWRLSSGR